MRASLIVRSVVSVWSHLTQLWSFDYKVNYRGVVCQFSPDPQRIQTKYILTKVWLAGVLLPFQKIVFLLFSVLSVSVIILTLRYLTSLGVRPNTKQLSFLGVPWTATYDDMSCKYSQYYVPVWYGVTLFLCMWSVVRHVVTLLVVIVRHAPLYCPTTSRVWLLSHWHYTPTIPGNY